MVLPEDDLSGKRRPIPVDSGGNRPQSFGTVGHGNRPILLSPRNDSLPDTDEDEDDEGQEDTDLREILRNAPAWLVSTVFHMLLLIMLGLWAYAVSSRDAKLEVEVSYAEDLGDQLDDPSMLDSSGLELDTLPENLITPPDLKPVEDPLAMPPELADINLNLPATTSAIDNRTIGAPIGLALKGREAGSRDALRKKYGGTAETEAAVEAGLAWLAKQQREDGTWSMVEPYANAAAFENVPAATAMALLAFQGHGDTHLSGQYSDNVKRGWEALLKLQRADGQFGGEIGLENQQLYAHAQCTIALCELFGMTGDDAFREPALNALRFAAAAQDRTLGGWRYRPRLDSDTSVTGWFVMAFQSARMAELSVPADVLTRVNGFLDKVQIEDGRGYTYQPNRERTHAVCAEGLLCRQYLGWRQNDIRLIEGVGWLVENVPLAYDKSLNQDIYYWYYCTQAAHHMEGQIWQSWNNIMRQEVPARQEKQGPEQGSWDPRDDKWGYNGRLYVTCLSIYMLEVYYRHLPLYARDPFAGVGGKAIEPMDAADPKKESMNTPPIDPIESPDAQPSDTKPVGTTPTKS